MDRADDSVNVQWPGPILSHTTHYQSFFLLCVDVNIAEEPLQIEGVSSSSWYFCGRSGVVKISDKDIFKSLASTLRKHNVHNVARQHCGKCPILEVDFSNERSLHSFLESLQDNRFQSDVAISLKQFVEPGYDISVDARLYLATPSHQKKDCVLKEVTFDNHRECIAQLLDGAVFDFGRTFASVSKITREISLQVVLKELKDVTHWFPLGIFLGIPYSQMSSIQQTYPQFSQQKEALIEVIHLWMELKEATWTNLISGLKNAGQVALAKKLASKYVPDMILDRWERQSFADGKTLTDDEVMSKVKVVEESELRLEKAKVELQNQIVRESDLKKDLEEIRESLKKVTLQAATFVQKKEEVKTKLDKRKSQKEKLLQYSNDDAVILEIVREIDDMISELEHQLTELELNIYKQKANEDNLQHRLQDTQKKIDEEESKLSEIKKEKEKLQATLAKHRLRFNKLVQENAEKKASYEKKESEDEHVQLTEESEGLQNVPGLHLDQWGVTNRGKIFAKHIHQNGAFLVRPSATRMGTFKVSVVVNKDVYGYCIYCDDDGQYYLSSDAERKFHTIKELVEAYVDSPFQAKIRTTANIYLKHPIQKPKSLYGPDQVWKEFYDVKEKKPFYYNRITGVSTWEKPDTGIIDVQFRKKPRNKKIVSVADLEFDLNFKTFDQINEESDEDDSQI